MKNQPEFIIDLNLRVASECAQATVDALPTLPGGLRAKKEEHTRKCNVGGIAAIFGPACLAF